MLININPVDERIQESSISSYLVTCEEDNWRYLGIFAGPVVEHNRYLTIS
jgi:hypothetical protein